MIWEERIRGSYPVTAYALGDDGSLTRAAPRPSEVRAYDLTRIALNGDRTAEASFSTQTLSEIEVSATSASFLGMTAKEVYLFHNGSKTQFLGDRHIVFIDTAISAAGRRLFVAYSDMAGVSFETACGEIDGKLLWARNVATSLNCTAISRNGDYMAYGTEAGVISFLDFRQREEWQFLLEEPVRALACDATGRSVVYGTGHGKVGCIGVGGERIWEITLSGEVLSAAMSADGSVVAVITSALEDEGARLYCLAGNGSVALETHFPKRLSGLSVSANGAFLATGYRDGTAQVYEILSSSTGDLTPRTVARNPEIEAEALVSKGEWEQACMLLSAATAADPANLALFDLHANTFKRWLEARFAAVQAYFEAQDYASAVALLEAMHKTAPKHIPVLSLLQQASMGLSKQWMEHGKALEQQGDEDGAEHAYKVVAGLQPQLREPREGLKRIHERRVVQADQQAEERLKKNDFEGALRSLERAQSLLPTKERAEKIAETQISLEFSAGMESYSQKQYPQAIFQFQKVLAKDPDHAEAKRYLQYAQRFSHDAAAETVQSRFSMLE